MKKVLSILVVICVMFSCMSFAQAADYSLAINNNVAIMVGNTNAIAWNSIVQTVAPVEEDGVMLAPVGFVTAAFNGTVEKTGVITALELGDTKAFVVEGNRNVVVNGRVYNPEIAPKVVNGEVMLPVTFLGETVLGKNVYYDAETKLAVISHRKCLSSRDKDAISTIAGAITSGSLPEISIKAPVAVITDPQGGVAGGFVETGKLTFESVYADQEPEPENNGMCMIDGNLSTRWASQGAGSATLDLGAVKPVTNVKVAVWKPTERSTNYAIEVSADGKNFTNVFNGGSSGATYDSYDVNDSIRYVRINTNGTTVGDWASILELEAWNGTAVTPSTGTAVSGATGVVSAAPSGTKVSLTANMLTASQEPEAANSARNLIDGTPATVWASQGDASVVIDLGSAKTVSSVGVAMKLYEDDRTIPYDIEVSADGISYSQVWTGSSEPFSDATQYVNFTAPARFVRVTGHGNTISGWNSIGEVEIYSSGAATGVTTTTTNTATGTAASNATGTKVALMDSMITVSQEPEPANNASNIIDGSKGTVWASQGEAFVVIDLGAEKNLASVGVAMKLYEDDRTIPYKVEVSANGAAYTEIWSGSSEPFSDATQYVTTSEKARFVRVTAYGNTVSSWNSVAEVEVYTK